MGASELEMYQIHPKSWNLIGFYYGLWRKRSIETFNSRSLHSQFCETLKKKRFEVTLNVTFALNILSILQILNEKMFISLQHKIILKSSCFRIGEIPRINY
jgi:hypothetical protein